MKAEATKRRSDGATKGRKRRGFSLAEVMLAMFILGIGIVAIASIFPAGIAQQRQAADDIIGPIVAENALAVLRTKLRPDDFGTFEELIGSTPEFTSDPNVIAATLPGDWPWRRPGFYLRPRMINLPNGPVTIRPGSITVFENASEPGDAASEVPWNGSDLSAGGPLVIINQRERYYPMQTDSNPNSPRPEYVWDCMFRRFQGQVLVAIFVYRVSLASGGTVTWAVPYSIANAMVPPLPVDKELVQWWNATGADPATPRDDAEIPGTAPGTAYDPANIGQNWQAPGQWLLDQNNNIIRILSGRRSQDEGPVELVRPVPPIAAFGPSSPKYLGSPFFYSSSSANPGLEGIVNRIWYIPSEVTLDVDGDMSPDAFELKVTLTPVYIGVSEL